MQYTNELFFLASALILWGLSIISIPLVKSKKDNNSDSYWFWALIALACAYSLFAIASTTFLALLTLANICFVASHLFFAFFSRSLHKPVTQKWKYLSLVGLLVFGIVFEIMRQNGSFLSRVSLAGMISIFCMIWTITSLNAYGVKKSKPLKFLFVTMCLALTFGLARIALLHIESPDPNINLYKESIQSTFFRLCWFSFQALSYIAVIGYFIEKISVDKALSELERKRIEGLSQELQSVNRLLEEKNELLQALGEEKLKSEKASEAKGQFLANISHEIRTPLHGVIGLISVILKSSMSEDVRKSLGKVLYSSKALLVILNDILDFSKIEAGGIEIHEDAFKVKHLMDDVQDLFSIPATDKGIELRFDIDPATPEVLIGDFYKLRQILFNLVGNSIKFTQQGYVEVKVQVNQIEEELVRLTFMVKDSGIGIPEKDLHVIFEPFNQLDNTNTRRYDGVGLGLPITRNILLKMGSDLVMKSQPRVGTEATFAVQLKINHNTEYKDLIIEASVQQEVSGLQYPSLVGRRVLVAEDNPINIEVVRQYLNFLKIESYFVTDGFQCLEALKNKKFDYVLMDIQMPNLDGIHTTLQIRLIEELKNLPIIGLSASVAEKSREEGIQSGMNDFLGKPFEIEGLAKMLIKHLPA